MITAIIITVLAIDVLYLMMMGVSKILYLFHTETECERLLRENHGR